MARQMARGSAALPGACASAGTADPAASVKVLPASETRSRPAIDPDCTDQRHAQTPAVRDIPQQ
jgi:hypothetical protein